MIRRWLVVLLLAELAIALAVAWAAARHGVLAPLPALGCGLAAVLLLRLLITMNNFHLSWRKGSATPARHVMAPLPWLRMLVNEYLSTMLASSWTMLRPLGWQLQPAGQGRGLPVLLLHGYACNGGYWRQLSRRLHGAGISHVAADLEPPGGDIDGYADQVHALIGRLCARTGSQQVLIVGHSMGGLVARAYLRRHGSAGVARVITLGTPHQGTALAGFGPGRNAVQMRYQGAWLAALAAQEDAARRSLVTSIFSHHDNIIAPQDSCFLPGARNIELGAVGHVALGRHASVLQLTLEEIAAASAQSCAVDSAGALR